MAAAARSFACYPNPVKGKASVVPTFSCQATTGVETKARNVNFYRVLSLESEKASAQEIKTAYRSLARRLHPDVCPPERKDEGGRALVEVNRAYEVLSDPALRRDHDAELGLLEIGADAGRRGVPRVVWKRQLDELRRRSDLGVRRRGRRATVAW